MQRRGHSAARSPGRRWFESGVAHQGCTVHGCVLSWVLKTRSSAQGLWAGMSGN